MAGAQKNTAAGTAGSGGSTVAVAPPAIDTLAASMVAAAHGSPAAGHLAAGHGRAPEAEAAAGSGSPAGAVIAPGYGVLAAVAPAERLVA